jgi:hypothetical protein
MYPIPVKLGPLRNVVNDVAHSGGPIIQTLEQGLNRIFHAKQQICLFRNSVLEFDRLWNHSNKQKAERKNTTIQPDN